MARLLPLLALLLFAATSGGLALTLVDHGRPAGTLVLGALQGPAVPAAADLQRVVERMSGAQLHHGPSPPPSPGGRGGIIAVGREADFPGILDQPLGKTEIALWVTGGTLYVLGGSDQAVSDAVYTLLDRLGCRWYMPGEIGEVIPARQTITVPDNLRVRFSPAFAWRHPWCAFGFQGEYGSQGAARRWGDWYRRNRCGGDQVWMSHNLLTPIPPERYFKDHPEWYALVNGKRKPSQPCTSNPDLLPVYVEAINRYFDEHPQALSYSLSPEDNADFCECESCRALDSGLLDPGFGGRPVVTDRLVKFFNAVSERVRQCHPDKFVTYYAYFNHTLPPTTVKLGPGVGTGLTAQQFCSMHGVHDRTCASRQKMRAILAEYGRQTPHLFIREYDPAPYTAGLPYPLFFVHAREMRVYRNLGVQGLSIEAHKAWASTFPNLWFYARWMWDPDGDEQAALREMCRDLYGPAAAPMERYYRTLEGAFAKSQVHLNWGLKDYARVWRPETIALLGQALREARALSREADPGVRERVLYAHMEYGYLCDYLAFTRAVAAGQGPQALALGDRLLADLRRQRDLNEDLCLYPDCVQRIGRLVLEAKRRFPEAVDLQRHDLVCRLSAVWDFRPDPKGEGEAQGWQREEGSKGWRRIRVDRQWYEQIKGGLTGTAWARTTFRVPARFAGRRILLWVGALDERGIIYLNGQEVCRRLEGLGENAWMEPFTVDLTAALRPGEINRLVVQAAADTTLGGVWQGALVYSPKE